MAKDPDGEDLARAERKSLEGWMFRLEHLKALEHATATGYEKGYASGLVASQAKRGRLFWFLIGAATAAVIIFGLKGW